MFVHAFVAAVGTCPEPAVFALFDGGNEVFADFVGGGFGVAVFGQDDLSQFLWTRNRHQQRSWGSAFREPVDVAAHLRPTRPCHLSSLPRLLLPAYPGIDSSSLLFSPPIDHG